MAGDGDLGSRPDSGVGLDLVSRPLLEPGPATSAGPTSENQVKPRWSGATTWPIAATLSRGSSAATPARQSSGKKGRYGLARIQSPISLLWLAFLSWIAISGALMLTGLAHSMDSPKPPTSY